MKSLRNGLLVVAVMAALSGAAFGWGPNTHGRMADVVLAYPTITPYLTQYGLDAGDIADMAYELDLPTYKDTYHSPAWATVRDCLWLTDPKWDSLSESRQLAFMIHIASDAGVPMSHSPANDVWTNTTLEAALEARVDTWSSSPSITPYTGTYAQKINTFYSQEIALANWAKSNVKWYNVATGSAGKTAGWSGVTYGQNLCEAMLLEYFATRTAMMNMSKVERLAYARARAHGATARASETPVVRFSDYVPEMREPANGKVTLVGFSRTH